MKTIKCLSCLAAFFFVSLQLYAQQQPTDFSKLVECEAKAASKKLNVRTTTTGNTYDVIYNRFEWNVDPAQNDIEGNVTTYFKVGSNSITVVDFDLSTIITADSVLYHGSSILISHFAELLTCMLPAPLTPNTIDSITVYYHGSPGATGFGSFINSAHGSNVPVMWTLSEPFGASDWWPCKNSLTDKIDSIDVLVTTPSAYRVASNGVLLSETVSGANTTFHWSSHYPIASYLVAIAVTNYAYYSDYVPLTNGDSIEVLNYVYPEGLAAWQAATPTVIDAIQLYDSLTITYPFAEEKYGHAQFGWGGGMEHQTMSFVGGFNQPLLAHELAHQWFGDHITCGSWEDIWLNEGFATYFEGLTQQFLYPQNWYYWKWSKVSNITSLPDGSVKCTDTTDIGRIFSGRLTYNKGAYLLHMLRWELGDTDFFQGLKNYLNDPALAGGFAKTPQLKQHMETASGLNLTTFFNQWYYGEGNPSYQIVWNQSGNTVNATINQTTSHASVSFYSMHVPIQFSNATNDTIVVLNNTSNSQSFSFQLPFTADSAVFDPELWILSSNNTVISGVISEQENNLVQIYPNPAMATLNVNFKNNFPEQLSIENVLGQSVLTKIVSTQNNTINISTLSNGTYFLKFVIANNPTIIRFTKVD